MALTDNFGTQYYAISCGIDSLSSANLSSNVGTTYFHNVADDYILWGQSTQYPPVTSNKGTNYYFLQGGVPSDSGLVLNSNSGTHYYYSPYFNSVSFCNSNGTDDTLNSLALAYKQATGISSVRAIKLSNFFNGLSTIGLASNFVDGWSFRQDSQPAGTNAYSLRTTRNLTIMSGNIPALSGDLSIVYSDMRNVASLSGERVAVYLNRPANIGPFQQQGLWGGQYGSNYIAYSYDGLGNFTPFGIPVHAPSDPRYSPVCLSNSSTVSVSSLMGRIITTTEAVSSLNTYSTTGNGNLIFTNLTIGRYSDNGVTWKSYTDDIVPYTLLFNKVLTNSDFTLLNGLIDSTLHPKYRFIPVGDSMSSNSVGISLMINLRNGFYGSNMDLIDTLAFGGATSSVILISAINSGKLSSYATNKYPVFCTVWMGQNDRPATEPTGDFTHTNCRTAWKAAKDAGMRVIAFTITNSSSISAAGQQAMDNRDRANLLIRQDQGQGYYDYLVDIDQIMLNTSLITPYFNDPLYYTFPDHVHFSSTIPGGNTLLIDNLYSTMGLEVP